MMRQYERFEIDMSQQPILVYPTLHYQNGGIEINDNAETAVANLFAAGETSGGIHGKNRLMGNSLLDILVFGRRAGENAAGRAEEVSVVGPGKLEHVLEYSEELQSEDLAADEMVSPQVLPPYARRAGERVLPY
jgi:succinate dehydrogenase / fumarate reductase flavoprotein subunit